MGLAEYNAAMSRYYRGDDDALGEAMDLLTPDVLAQLEGAERAAVARKSASAEQAAYWAAKRAAVERDEFWKGVGRGASSLILGLFLAMAVMVFAGFLAWGLAAMGHG